MAKVIKAKGLDAILAAMTEDELRPGEFTASQVHEQHRAQGGTRTAQAIRCMLDEMVRNGDMTKRLVLVNGHRQSAYSAK